MSRNSLRRRPSLALAGILIAIGGCAENPSAAAPREFVQRTASVRFDKSGGGSASAMIGVDGGVLQTSAGDRIVFPAGAVEQPIRISITSDSRYAGVQLEPHGLQFPEGHEPVLQLSTASTNAGAFRNVDVVYVDEAGAISEVLPTTSTGANLETHLHHFSGYLASGH